MKKIINLSPAEFALILVKFNNVPLYVVSLNLQFFSIMTSQTSIAQTPMACLTWLLKNFKLLRNSSDRSRKIFRDFFYFIMALYIVCTH